MPPSTMEDGASRQWHMRIKKSAAGARSRERESAAAGTGERGVDGGCGEGLIWTKEKTNGENHRVMGGAGHGKV